MVPELRDELLKYLQTPRSLFTLRMAATHYGWAGFPRPDSAFVDESIQKEIFALRSAELYFVSTDMAALAVAAGKTLPSFTLDREDIPGPNGLLIFDTPIDSILEFTPDGGVSTDAVPIIGFSWTIFNAIDANHFRQGGLYLTVYSWNPSNTPRLRHDNELLIPFEYPYDLNSEFFKNSIIATYGRTFITALLLMQQPGMARTQIHEPDALDRAILKRKHRKPEEVRVINLRYAPTPKSNNSNLSSRTYDHRWAVRGHWRKQWYPKRNGHLPIWIDSYIKGPEGASLITGEKVYAWTK